MRAAGINLPTACTPDQQSASQIGHNFSDAWAAVAGTNGSSECCDHFSGVCASLWGMVQSCG